jgi:hypothetical protein
MTLSFVYVRHSDHKAIQMNATLKPRLRHGRRRPSGSNVHPKFWGHQGTC